MSPSQTCLRFYVSLVAFVVLTACGGAEFHGGTSSKSRTTPPATPVPPGTGDGTPVQPNDPANPGTLNLTWQWECADDSSAPSTTSFVGPGPHNIKLDGVASLAISTAGNFCQPARDQRDIMFLVDVSQSMTVGSGGIPAADPVSGNTCARLQTIEQVIAMTTATDEARFSVATFSGLAQQASFNFHTTQASMFSELLVGSGSGIDNILCAGLSGTNYTAGLTSIEGLVNKTRPTAVKEVYFISDGAPAAGQEGIDKATAIKTKSTIVTVMLGEANDTVLKDSIATKDPNGNPLHARAKNSGELADIVKRMARNGIRGGTFKYRTVGATEWKQLDMTPHIKDGKFNLPVSALEIQGAKGVEVEFTYWDLHNRKTTKTGTLNFI